MMKNTPSLEEWRKLYKAAIQIKEVAPWEWMEETDVFGIQNPKTDELGFVSVMGMLGEHYAIAVYLGAEALNRFWQIHRNVARKPKGASLMANEQKEDFVKLLRAIGG